MITKNNWITTNIIERRTNKEIDFKVDFHFYKETYSKNFKQACLKAAKEIGKKYPNIFLGLSGGLDSSYVFKILVEAKVSFVPIITIIEHNPSNMIQSKRALNLCIDAGIKPIVNRISEKELFDIYYEEFFFKMRSKNIFYVPAYQACQHAFMNNGICIIGEHIVDDLTIGELKFVIAEAEASMDVLINESIYIPFFYYSQNIVYHTIKDGLEHCSNGSELKRRLYGDDTALVKGVLIDKNVIPSYLSAARLVDQETTNSDFHIDPYYLLRNMK